jgi:translocation and assembly module TamA
MTVALPASMLSSPALMRGIAVVLVCATAGCALLRGDKKTDERGASAASVDERRARYRLDVQAPRPLREMLAQHLDLARFRDAPAREGLTGAELDRLVALAPEQARALLATQGYFNPLVSVERLPPDADGLPLVRVAVQPGPRTVVQDVRLEVLGDLRQRADAGQPDARALSRRLGAEWPLKVGMPFQQEAWTGAKNATLGQLHAGGYPTAVWASTDAAIGSRDNSARLAATAQSGPLFHFGELSVEGLQRYDERAVRNVWPFSPGTPYTEQRLIDLQERLVRTGLFEGAVAEIDPDPQRAAAAPVTVRVQEHPLQKLTLGVGASTDTGVRGSVQHTHRQPFGLRWTTQNNLELGPQRKALEFDYRSYPKSGFRRNMIAGEVERWRGDDERRDALRLRVGRAWEDPRLERQVYGEYQNTRVRAPVIGDSRAQALTANVSVNKREVDSLLLPLRGRALLLQGAAGYSRSSTDDSGPVGRAYARLMVFRPLPNAWHGTARVEVGQVFAKRRVGVPDTMLFRAGGDESVRGYGYRSLGPVVEGVVTSGRSLLTASAEVARPISQRMPQLWGAAFVDAGDAAERFGDLRPKVGVGVGVRYRSPVGPLKLDVAYGVEDRKVRLHLAAGMSF